MLSAKVIENAQQAEHYFSQDNYYTTEEGFEQSAWAGIWCIYLAAVLLARDSQSFPSRGSA